MWKNAFAADESTLEKILFEISFFTLILQNSLRCTRSPRPIHFTLSTDIEMSKVQIRTFSLKISQHLKDN